VSRSCAWSTIVVWAAITGSLANPLTGQTAAAPSSVMRRLGQMLFPLVLFDSTGKPELGQLLIGDPHTQLQVHQAEPSPALPGVKAWQGWAFRCFDCAVDRAAVVQVKGDDYSIARIEDLGPVLQVLLPAREADSAAVRVHLLALLNLTCILDCHARVIGSLADVTTPLGPQLCQPISPALTFAIEPGTQGTNGSFADYSLTLQTGFWITRLHVLWSRDHYVLHAERIADCYGIHA
jgi:hypothetical protein